MVSIAVRQTKRLLFMCQNSKIVLRARHIPRRMNVLADVLFRSTQVSATEWSLRPSVFQAVIREWGIRVVSTSFCLPSSHTGVGNQSGPYVLSSKQSYGSGESEWSLRPVFQAVIREWGIRVVPTSFCLPSSHTGVGNQSGPYVLLSSKQSYGSGESEWSLRPSVFQAVIREWGIRVVPTSFCLPSSHTGVGNQSGPYVLLSSKQSYGSGESEWSLRPSVFQAVIREWGIRVVPTSFCLPSSHTGVGNQSGPYVLLSSKQSYGSGESEWSLRPSVFQAVIREWGIRVVPTSFCLPSSHTGVGNQSGPYVLLSSKQSYGSGESEWSLRPSVFQAVIREWGIRVVPTSFCLLSSHTGVGNQRKQRLFGRRCLTRLLTSARVYSGNLRVQVENILYLGHHTTG